MAFAGSVPAARARSRRSRAWFEIAVVPALSNARATTHAAAYNVAAEPGSCSKHRLTSCVARSKSPRRAREHEPHVIGILSAG